MIYNLYTQMIKKIEEKKFFLTFYEFKFTAKTHRLLLELLVAYSKI